MLLHQLQHLRGIASRRFVPSQVNVLRHHHIAQQQERVFGTNLAEYFCKSVSGPDRPEEWLPPVAAKGNKVQIAFALVAL
jgi:hypothetical protein